MDIIASDYLIYDTDMVEGQYSIVLGTKRLLDLFDGLLSSMGKMREDVLFNERNRFEDIVPILMEKGYCEIEKKKHKEIISYSLLTMYERDGVYGYTDRELYLDPRVVHERMTSEYREDIEDIDEDIIEHVENEVSVLTYDREVEGRHIVLDFREFRKEYNYKENKIENILYTVKYYGSHESIVKNVLGEKRMTQLELLLFKKWNRVFI